MPFNPSEHNDTALYRLMAWLSPSYPVGAFSYSHGIEYAVEDGLVTDRDTLVDWIATVLMLGTGRADGVLMREIVIRASAGDGDGVAEIASFAAAFQGTSELAAESLGQGNAFLTATRASWPAPLLDEALGWVDGDCAYPVAVGLACAAHRIPLKGAMLAYLYGFAANLVSAGVRLVPLGQTDGQLALRALEPVVCNARDAALSTPLEELGTATPVVDWTSMQHETQYTRLFRS
jgi:urease accessory protein